VWNNLVKAALARLFLAVPFLGYGPIGVIVSWIVNKYAGMLFDVMHLAVDMEVISLRNEAHRKAFDKSLSILKVLAYDKGVESDEYKSARATAKENFATLLRPIV
jgi:hypothetical protein